MTKKIELSVGDVVFLLDTLKVISNIITSKHGLDYIDEVVVESEGLLNKAMKEASTDECKDFREFSKTVEWGAEKA